MLHQTVELPSRQSVASLLVMSNAEPQTVPYQQIDHYCTASAVRPARGIVIALLMSIALWGIIIAAILGDQMLSRR